MVRLASWPRPLPPVRTLVGRYVSHFQSAHYKHSFISDVRCPPKITSQGLYFPPVTLHSAINLTYCAAPERLPIHSAARSMKLQNCGLMNAGTQSGATGISISIGAGPTGAHRARRCLGTTSTIFPLRINSRHLTLHSSFSFFDDSRRTQSIRDLELRLE